MKDKGFHLFVAVFCLLFIAAFSSCIYFSIDQSERQRPQVNLVIDDFIKPQASIGSADLGAVDAIRTRVLREVMAACTGYASDGEMNAIVHSIKKHSDEFGIDPYLLLSMVVVESGCDPMAESSAKAKGLMQVREIAHREYRRYYDIGGQCPGLWDIDHNIEVGTGYLALLMEMYSNNIRKAVAAYNLGPAGVKRAKLPTRYTKKVMARMEEFLNG